MEGRYEARNDVEDEVKATTLPADATSASKGINGLISVWYQAHETPVVSTTYTGWGGDDVTVGDTEYDLAELTSSLYAIYGIISSRMRSSLTSSSTLLEYVIGILVDIKDTWRHLTSYLRCVGWYRWYRDTGADVGAVPSAIEAQRTVDIRGVI
jgi:hypothetical protein